MTHQAAADRLTTARHYLFVFAVALAFRLAFVAMATRTSPPDTDGYVAIAQNVVAGEGFALVPGEPTAFRPPVYPYFIAGVTRIFSTPEAALWLQAILSSFVVFVAAWLTRRIIGELFALVAAAVVAIDPYLVAVCGEFMTECIFATLVSISTALFIWALRARSVTKYAFAGLAAGLTAMTRPEFLIFLPGAALTAFVWGRKRRKAWCIAAFLLASSLFPCMWGWRNSHALGKWVFTTTHGGYTHRLAYNEVFYGEVVAGPRGIWSKDSLEAWQETLAAETEGMNELEIDAHHYGKAREFTSADRLRAAHVAAFEAARFWAVTPHGPGRLARGILAAFFLCLGGLAAVGAYVSWKTRPAAFLAIYLLLAETLVHTYYWSNIRMRVPFHPLLSVLAAVGLATLFGRKLSLPEPVAATGENTLYYPAV